VGISISDLRGDQPGDATLQSLLGILSAKLELCSRLPIFEYEASNAGHDRCAAAFRRLAEVERRSFRDLLETLHGHLDEARASGAEEGGRSTQNVPTGGRT
jgi:hypothetical protein